MAPKMTNTFLIIFSAWLGLLSLASALLIALWGVPVLKTFTKVDPNDFVIASTGRISQCDYDEAVGLAKTFLWKMNWLWFQFAINVFLVTATMLICCYGVLGPVLIFGFLLMCLLPCFGETLILALMYPGVFFNPWHTFGIVMLVLFILKYLLAFILLFLAWNDQSKITIKKADKEEATPEYDDNTEKSTLNIYNHGPKSIRTKYFQNYS